ncbi:MAG: hypothetical protein ACXW3C_00135, partial [Pyrinomonadaceae bacterium]
YDCGAFVNSLEQSAEAQAIEPIQRAVAASLCRRTPNKRSQLLPVTLGLPVFFLFTIHARFASSSFGAALRD